MKKIDIILALVIAFELYATYETDLIMTDDKYIDNSQNMHFGKIIRNKVDHDNEKLTQIQKKQETEYEKIIQLITILLEQKSLRETNKFLQQKISAETREIIKNVINASDSNYIWHNTFLHRAVTALQVEQLLLLGADPTIKNDLGQIPLMTLLSCGKCEAAKMLLLKSAPNDCNCSDDHGINLVFYVIQAGETEILDLILKKGAKLDIGIAGFTPLIIAIQAQKPAMVRFLLKLGVPVNEAIPEGTSLPNFGSSDFFEKADISGTTPLMFAAIYDAESVKLLLKAGADVNAVRVDGATALILSYGNQPEAVQDLLNAGADIHVKSKKGLTPLFAAAATNHDTIITLLKRGADVNAGVLQEMIIYDEYCPSMYFNLQGMTPLLMAISVAPETVPFMIECGADVNHATIEGITPLIMASLTNPNLIPLLVQHGAVVNCATVQTSAFVQITLAYKILSSSQYLVAGLTPLMISTLLGDVDSVSILIKYGVDRKTVNCNGLTAFDMAKAYGLKNIMELLVP